MNIANELIRDLKRKKKKDIAEINKQLKLCTGSELQSIKILLDSWLTKIGAGTAGRGKDTVLPMQKNFWKKH